MDYQKKMGVGASASGSSSSSSSTGASRGFKSVLASLTRNTKASEAKHEHKQEAAKQEVLIQYFALVS